MKGRNPGHAGKMNEKFIRRLCRVERTETMKLGIR